MEGRVVGHAVMTNVVHWFEHGMDTRKGSGKAPLHCLYIHYYVENSFINHADYSETFPFA